MKREEVQNFTDRPCRFRLKSGKEIYGIIWEWIKENTGNTEYYFASNGDVMRFRRERGNFNIKPEPQIGTYIQLEDIIYAEQINL